MSAAPGSVAAATGERPRPPRVAVSDRVVEAQLEKACWPTASVGTRCAIVAPATCPTGGVCGPPALDVRFGGSVLVNTRAPARSLVVSLRLVTGSESPAFAVRVAREPGHSRLWRLWLPIGVSESVVMALSVTSGRKTGGSSTSLVRRAPRATAA